MGTPRTVQQLEADPPQIAGAHHAAARMSQELNASTAEVGEHRFIDALLRLFHFGEGNAGIGDGDDVHDASVSCVSMKPFGSAVCEAVGAT